MIKLFDSNEKLFNHNGIKILKPLKCYVYKEDNGDYYIELEDSIDNIDYYQANMIITCPTPFPEGVQAFRLSNPIKNLSKISVKAKHVYFDRANYIVEDSYIVNKNCGYALNYLNSNTDIESPFNTSSNITTNNSYRCVRKTLQEADNVILKRWGGHLVRNNFSVAINSNIGADRGITLKYAKNITNIKSEENWNNVVTKILPVGKDGILLPEKYLEIGEKIYDIPFTKVVSFEQNHINEEDYSNKQEYENSLIDDLRSQATSFLVENKTPKVNYSLSAHLNRITDVGDTIYVEHPRLRVAITTNIISVKWDAISKKYKNIEFGNFKNSLKNLINDVTKQVSQIAINISNETKAILEDELKQVTSTIWNHLGSSYVIYEGDKILVVDTIPKEEASKVMMINSGGIGFSTTGINGTFNSAWSIDGTLNMQNINVINLVADMIKGGTLKVGGDNNTNGAIEIYDSNNNLISKIDKDGFSITINGQKNELNDLLSQMYQTQDNQNKKMMDIQMTVDGVNISVSDIKKDVSNMQDNLSNVSDNVDNLNNNLNNTNETIQQMNYNFSTEALKINSGKDPVNTSINNKGLQVYNYTTLKSVINDKGAGFDDLIVTNTAQLAYLKFMKSTDESGNLCTDIHHLVSNVQKITDLVGDD